MPRQPTSRPTTSTSRAGATPQRMRGAPSSLARLWRAGSAGPALTTRASRHRTRGPMSTRTAAATRISNSRESGERTLARNARALLATAPGILG
eukprot:4044634-Prymnesium_polylepis.1